MMSTTAPQPYPPHTDPLDTVTRTSAHVTELRLALITRVRKQIEQGYFEDEDWVEPKIDVCLDVILANVLSEW